MDLITRSYCKTFPLLAAKMHTALSPFALCCLHLMNVNMLSDNWQCSGHVTPGLWTRKGHICSGQLWRHLLMFVQIQMLSISHVCQLGILETKLILTSLAMILEQFVLIKTLWLNFLIESKSETRDKLSFRSQRFRMIF